MTQPAATLNQQAPTLDQQQQPATTNTHQRRPILNQQRSGKSPFRHWLGSLNTAVAIFVGGAFAAPVLAALGWLSAASALYNAYHFACHQWAFRSFFLFGPVGQPAIFSQQQLADQNVDPFTFVGSPEVGWKLAFCERDLAIYIGLLVVGVLYARRRRFRPLGFALYGVLIVPMALDGFTQLFGWRESTWELRVITGLLFGVASAWLVLPRLDVSFGLRPDPERYAPPTACQAIPASEPEPLPRA